MMADLLIENTIAFVKQQLEGAEAGHDWFHIERVFKTTQNINEAEKGDATVVELAALLHDIADPKFHDGDEELGPKIAGQFLEQQAVNQIIIDHVLNIIRHMSFKQSFDAQTFDSLELRIVRDADRLDAIGAIGIARAFTYGGFKNRVLYDPAIPPADFKDKEAYKNSNGHTINHFYEKLLLLKDLMHTQKGKELAAKRHEFMEGFLEQFYAEWRGVV
ncbi:MAG: HD domain-containing protein [Moraxellaceae bacterium]|nr:MAG: HD domain-containing protein [Moraxellaceae bacterium]